MRQTRTKNLPRHTLQEILDMNSWQGLSFEAQGTGISVPLSEQINLLGGLLGRVIEAQASPEILGLVEELRRLTKQAITQQESHLRDQVIERIKGLGLQEIEWLLRAFTTFFYLVNQSEQQEIIRINRERARLLPEAGRVDSIDEAVGILRRADYELEDVLKIVSRLDIQPTLTAHPTEARRRTILYKQEFLASLIDQLRYSKPTPGERDELLHQVHNQIGLLVASDKVRASKPTVIDEVENGLHYLRNAIWETIPRIHKDVVDAIERHYNQTVDVPVFLKFRSWIGGDRDGNPNVTAEVTRKTFSMHRRTALARYLADLRSLRRDLSISELQLKIPEALYESIACDKEVLCLSAHEARQFVQEPFRQKISFMMQRIELARDGDYEIYNSANFITDLQLLARALEDMGYGSLVSHGRLGKLLLRAQAFGFHMVSLDIRQHSRHHGNAVHALFKVSDVCDDYLGLAEEDKLDLLTKELQNPRPLLPHGVELEKGVQEVLNTFSVIKETVEWSPSALGSYVISMTHAVSHVLEVLLLAKETGLWRIEGDRVHSPIDVVPLFETIEDLDLAGVLLTNMFEHPAYKKHLEHRDNMQEVMLGYSDSNKDGGYWMANWALHKAKRRIGKICKDAGIDLRLFHGRGGTVGRGGGRAGQAIIAMPRIIHNGRIRFTEQGEVISFRYALPAIAHRHLEQIVRAMMIAPLRVADVDEDAVIVERIADVSMKTYRKLIDDPEFWPWYASSTPIEQISRLPIASRPVSRGSVHHVDFDDLRAIPWVFAWTQTRYIVPGWYGAGEGLQKLLKDHGSDLKRMYKQWPFFQAVLNSAQREMARARLDVASEYLTLASDPKAGERINHRIVEDYKKAEAAILEITGHESLYGHVPVFRKSVKLRNPYSDVLNLLQVELIRRSRNDLESDKERLVHALLLSVNGIAAAMQSTG